MSTTGQSQSPLGHLKVLDLSRMYPGAFCTLVLADLGADVLKVEAPGAGDGIRPMVAPGAFNPAHTALNRGKRSVVLDLRHSGAESVFKRFVRWADVVIESHKPGQLDGLGLGYEVMSGENPAIVWCSLTGFGDFGPNANAAGHDVTYLGYSGLLSRLADAPSRAPRAPISAPLAGLMGAVGILAAVANAVRTGQGTRLDVNMVDTAMWTISEDVARAASASAPGPWETRAVFNVYPCADGREVTVASPEPRTWAALCEALELPELAGHRIGVDDDAKASARLAETFLTKIAAQWLTSPGLSGGVGPVNDAPDLLDDPQVTARGSLVPVAGSGARVLANPIRFHSAAGSETSHGLVDAPGLGAHTVEALTVAGFTAEEITALQADKVVS